VTRQVFTVVIRKRKSPASWRPKKRRHVCSLVKVMMILLTWNGLCTWNTIPCRQRTKKWEPSAWPLPVYEQCAGAHSSLGSGFYASSQNGGKRLLASSMFRCFADRASQYIYLSN